jgi:AAA+ superfamily predicted ATPase
VTIESGAEDRGFNRLKAVWPGPVFEFTPDLGGSGGEEVRSLIELFCAVGGLPGRFEKGDVDKMSPLNLLVWARNAAPKLLAGAAIDFGELVSSGKIERFRGSNEGSTALALKALAATAKRQGMRDGAVSFEDQKDTEVTDDLKVMNAKRVDLAVRGVGIFEIETLHGSGPIEDFYHRKVFSRLGLTSEDGGFHLVVPSDAILWAGPYLADIAYLLGNRGEVLIPAFKKTKDSTELSLVRIKAARLDRESVEVEDPIGELSGPVRRADDEKRILLADIAGYEEVRALIANEVIWMRKHALVSQAASQAAGILFYGPPGCGKSRIARAICGELGHEVRLRGPADFKGLYIGWGQHLVREEFAWLFEDDKRVLLIDEFDAIARSRREGQMHSDEKADVNELLVQLDRASRLGRLVLCTTNFVSSLDEAVIRSGRFSIFVPVGPPDAKAAQAIVSYYLNALGRDVSGNKIDRLDIGLPGEAAVQNVVAEACRAQIKGAPWLAGADFEQAVKRAFRCAARDATASSDGDQCTQLRVEITQARLQKALHEARRSIAWESIERFLDEIRAHSPSEADVVRASLLGASDQ